MAVHTRTLAPWEPLLETGEKDGRLVTRALQPGRAPVLEPLPADLHPGVATALGARGIDRLFSHQREAWDASAHGPVVITTGTASGKSLAFQLPTLDTLARDSRARALYLYPTKALAQDQARSLLALGSPNVRAEIYDGDTPREHRAAIRKRANLVLTNPEMLHLAILPNHPAWGDFLHNLAVVVVDEAHTYRGVFGSHVANVLRRLRRAAEAYGAQPRFLLASATIANAEEHAERLTGLDGFTHVERDGAPGSKRTIAMWNPPLEDEATGKRRSVLSEAAEMVAELVAGGSRTIAFMKSRKGVELVTTFAQRHLEELDPSLVDRIAPYRAGYTAAQRRELERKLVDGELLGVVATNALELGIDIGALDAAVCVTFPGTVASLKQMWGRAGRRGRGLAVYIAGEDALDQFFCRHPEQFLERPVESAILDPHNALIHSRHLLCAAHEGPLEHADAAIFGEDWQAMADRLVAAGELRRRGATYVPRRAEGYPAADVSLRSTGPDGVDVVDTTSGEIIGRVDGGRACSTVHEGAVYMHLGRSYEVAGLDLDGATAFVKPFSGGWYTQPKRVTDTRILELFERRDALGVQLSYGEVEVSEQVLAFQRKRISDHEALEIVALDLPETSFTTHALWYEIGDEVLDEFPMEVLLGSLHAAEHSQIAVLPLLAMCDRWDIGGLSTNVHPQTGRATIFIYDGHPGGIGITRRGFTDFATLVGNAHTLLRECPCESGCPSCVQSPKCGNLNEPLSKRGALELMDRMLAAHPER